MLRTWPGCRQDGHRCSSSRRRRQANTTGSRHAFRQAPPCRCWTQLPSPARHCGQYRVAEAKTTGWPATGCRRLVGGDPRWRPWRAWLDMPLMHKPATSAAVSRAELAKAPARASSRCSIELRRAAGGRRGRPVRPVSCMMRAGGVRAGARAAAGSRAGLPPAAGPGRAGAGSACPLAVLHGQVPVPVAGPRSSKTVLRPALAFPGIAAAWRDGAGLDGGDLASLGGAAARVGKAERHVVQEGLAEALGAAPIASRQPSSISRSSRPTTPLVRR